MKITVVYTTTNIQFIKELDLIENSMVKDAVEKSGLLQQHPEVSLEKNKVGIFNQIVSLDTKLAENDRVEIYQPLIIDPMEARRMRANLNV